MEETRELENENQPKQVEKTVTTAGLGKRTIAGIIDLFFMIFIMLAFLNLVYQPIFNSAFKIPDLNQQQVQLKLDSHLYVQAEDKTINLVEAEKYLEVSEQYFESYCTSTDKACTIVGKSLADAVLMEEDFKTFYEKGEDGKLNYIGEEKDKAEIEKQVYYYAVTKFSQSDAYRNVTNKLDTYFNAEVYLSLFTSSLIFYLIIPLFLKDGKTLGKLIFKMSLTNPRGYKVKKSQIVVRFFSFFVINVLFGIFTIFIVPFISFTVMIFSKNASSLHDFCSATIVVDDASSVIYDSYGQHVEMKKQEELAYNQILEKRRQIKQSDQKEND